MSPEELSKRRKIGIKQTRVIISKTTKIFTRSELMPLDSRYNVDRVFQTKRLAGMWATDTMDRRVNSLDGNQYAQVFSHGIYFSEIYPMAKKDDTVQEMKTFLIELGVPEGLTVNGSREQKSPFTKFMEWSEEWNIVDKNQA